MAAKIEIIIEDGEHKYPDITVTMYTTKSGATNEEITLAEELMQEIDAGIGNIKLNHEEKRNEH